LNNLRINAENPLLRRFPKFNTLHKSVTSKPAKKLLLTHSKPKL